MPWVDKEKCMGCGVCVGNAPDSIRIGEDGKAEIVSCDEPEKCIKACPFGVIKE